MNKYYMGCGGNVSPEQLPEYEATGDWIVEPKCDGTWVSYNGTHCHSRTGDIKAVTLPPFDGILIGELAFGSQEGNKTKQTLGHDVLDVFDIAYFEDMSLLHGTDSFRRNLLIKVLPKDKRLRLVPQYSTGFTDILASQTEGVILKKRLSEHKYSSTNPYWLKVKKEFTVDMVAMDYEVSDAVTRRGIAKNITCGVYVKGKLCPLVKVGSFPVDLKKDIVENWHKYAGKVVEIKCFKVFESGSLRHPSLIRFRDDKLPEECTWEKLHDIL